MEIDIVRLHPCTQFLWSDICLKIRKALSTLARFVCILHVQGWKEQHMRQLHLGQIVWCQWFCSDFPHFPQNQSNYIIAVQQRETSYFWTAGNQLIPVLLETACMIASFLYIMFMIMSCKTSKKHWRMHWYNFTVLPIHMGFFLLSHLLTRHTRI